MSDLARQWRIGDLWLTDYPMSVRFGSDHGTPDLSATVLPSFLTDGDLEMSPRAGNRTITLPVLVEGSDLAVLAQSVDAMTAECDKQINTLYCDPGDGYGEPFQFTVFRGTVTPEPDDDAESAGFRLFLLTWRALPWPEATTEVTATLTTTSVSTAYQRIGTFTAKGSVSSRGSLSIQHATAGLAHVLVYTCPDDGAGYVPACRQYRTGGPTPVAGGPAGFYDPLIAPSATESVFVIPTDTLPAGEYAVVVFARNVSATDSALVHFSVVPRVSSTSFGSGEVGGDVTIPPLLGDRFFNLGMVHLPPVDMPTGALAEIGFAVHNASTTATFHLYDVYLLNVSTGRVSTFYCGTGAASSPLVNNRLWVDSPSVENQGLGRYVMGTLADRSDARSALVPPSTGSVDPAVHEFPAGGVKVFTVCSGPSTAVTTTYRYRPTGHSSVYSG